MRRLWIWFLPLLFLPNFGIDGKTALGNLKLSDLLIGPYLILLLFGLRKSNVRFDPKINKFGKYFLGWAAFGVLLFLPYYEYRNPMPVFWFISLKYAKFALYAVAGVLTAKALGDRDSIRLFHWSVGLCVIAIGVTCLVSFRESTSTISGEVYESSNQVSLTLSMFLTYLIALQMANFGTARWRKFSFLALSVGLIGLGFTDGRGGWIALLIGITYLVFMNKISARMVAYFAFGPIIFLFIYNSNENFRTNVDSIFNPNKAARKASQVAALGFDDGGRLHHILNEAPKVIYAPFFGTGFFHRGAYTELWHSGSHNFFLQMLLETGIIGAIFLFNFLKRLWRSSSRSVVKHAKLKYAYRSMFLVSCVGAMSGEYFYGGISLLTFLVLYAPIASVLSTGIYLDKRPV